MTTPLAIAPAQPFLPGYALPPVPPQGARVLLLRHGRSTLNDAGCYQGSSDTSELTAQGREASRRVGQYLSRCAIDCAIDRLYASPLRRAQQTVAELLPQLRPSVPVTTLDSLREIDLPAWEGLPYDAVKTRFPEDYRRWQREPEQFAMAARAGATGGRGDGESRPQSAAEGLIYPVRDLYRRAREFWTTTLPRHRGQTLLVVSHGGTLQALVNTALGLPIAQHHALQQTHSGLTAIDFAEPGLGRGHLHLLNLTTPIGEALPKLKAGKRGLRLVLLPCRQGSRPAAPLAQLIQRCPIAACAVEDHPWYWSCQRGLLSHRPDIPVRSLGQADFLAQWRRCLAEFSRAAADGLTTVVVLCHPARAEAFLRGVVGRPLGLCANTLTVLHYPDAACPPILQTLNAAALSPQPLSPQPVSAAGPPPTSLPQNTPC